MANAKLTIWTVFILNEDCLDFRWELGVWRGDVFEVWCFASRIYLVIWSRNIYVSIMMLTAESSVPESLKMFPEAISSPKLSESAALYSDWWSSSGSDRVLRLSGPNPDRFIVRLTSGSWRSRGFFLLSTLDWIWRLRQFGETTRTCFISPIVTRSISVY